VATQSVIVALRALGLTLIIISGGIDLSTTSNLALSCTLGTLVGVFIMAFLRNGCTMMAWPNYFQKIIVGAIIIAVVTLDRLRHRQE